MERAQVLPVPEADRPSTAGLVTAESDPERNSPRHEALRQLLIDRRLRSRMTQTDVARKLGMPQSYVSATDRGSRRVSVIH